MPNGKRVCVLPACPNEGGMSLPLPVFSSVVPQLSQAANNNCSMALAAFFKGGIRVAHMGVLWHRKWLRDHEERLESLPRHGVPSRRALGSLTDSAERTIPSRSGCLKKHRPDGDFRQERDVSA
jgi:hypothetical protein